MRPVIFLGPTLPADQARMLIDAEFRPPAAQGDVYRAQQNGARAIGLIDGLFHDVASVWHRELLHALSCGVHVFGAASMGALRAAELDGFGMRGVGEIYDAYRDGAWPGSADPFEDDDEVAVVHAPASAGGRAFSDAMVDIRATLQAATRDGAVAGERAEALVRVMKALHYPQRSIVRLAEIEPCLRDWLAAGAVARKRLDAIEMLRVMADFMAADPAPFAPAFRFERAQVWEAFVAGEQTREPSAEEARVLDRVRLDPPAWRAAVRAVLGRGSTSPPVGAPERRRQLDRLRRTHGLWRRKDLDAWASANGLDEPGLARLLDAEAALDRAARDERGRRSLTARVLDHLRASGEYAAWRRRVSPDAEDAAATAGPELLEWYFSGIGIDIPADVSAWAAAMFWPSRAAFDKAVLLAHRDDAAARRGAAWPDDA